MADRLPTRPPRPNWGNLSKNLALWLLVGLVALALFQMMSKQRNPTQEFSYTRIQPPARAGQHPARRSVRRQAPRGGVQESASRRTAGPPRASRCCSPSPTARCSSSASRTPACPSLAKEPKGGITADHHRGPAVDRDPRLLVLPVPPDAGGRERAFSFGKSKAKLLTGDTPKVTFADVAGADEAKQELQEIIEFLKDPQKFTKLGGRLPKGALLVGPPGTGKTLLAQGRRRRGGSSRSSRCPGSDFVEMFVGVGASRVRDLFEQGKAHAPCIIFIDEIDAVGRHRGAGLGGGHDEREQTLNQLLVEMDGFESNDGVILIAATNRPDVLDPGAAASGPLRPPDRRRRAGPARPRGHPQGAPAQQADRRRRGHHDARARHAGHGGRRSREPRERGGAARRAPQPRQDLHGRPRGREGQGHARRRAEVW